MIVVQVVLTVAFVVLLGCGIVALIIVPPMVRRIAQENRLEAERKAAHEREQEMRSKAEAELNTWLHQQVPSDEVNVQENRTK